jgi:hypothetical protein
MPKTEHADLHKRPDLLREEYVLKPKYKCNIFFYLPVIKLT